jgi:glycosyltransferase involved in cell wall biosynthesis
VVVPVYNCGEFLAPCLASLSKQTYENAEFIIVDDGSNDGSAMVCDRFAEKDPRFRIIHKVNGGVSAARNDGIDAAKGEYLMFLDGDDYIADETIADLVKSIEKHKSDIATITMANLVVAADSEGSSMNGMMSNRPIELAEGVYPASEISRAYIESEPLLTSVVWGKLFRRELWEGVRYPTHIGFEDTMTLPYVYNKAKTVSCISGDYYFYVQRAGSVMHQWGSSKKLCDFFDSRVFKITEFYNHGYADCGWTLERRLCEFSLGYLWSSIKRKGEDMAEYTKRKAWFDRQKWTVSGGKTTLCLVP